MATKKIWSVYEVGASYEGPLTAVEASSESSALASAAAFYGVRRDKLYAIPVLKGRRAHSAVKGAPGEVQLRVGQRFDHFGHTYEILKIGRDRDRTVQIARPHTDSFGKAGFIDHRSFPSRDFDRQHLRPIA